MVGKFFDTLDTLKEIDYAPEKFLPVMFKTKMDDKRNEKLEAM
jgi:hypothetical protein